MLDLLPKNANERPELFVTVCIAADVVGIGRSPCIVAPHDVKIGRLFTVAHDLAVSERVTGLTDTKDNAPSSLDGNDISKPDVWTVAHEFP
jgi:hypothetical protein